MAPLRPILLAVITRPIHVSPHNCGQPLGLCQSPSAHISVHIPKRSTGEEVGGQNWFCYTDHMCRQTTKRWSHYLAHSWNWKQEPVTAAATAAARASFGWVYGGSVGKAQSDGSAHADLLTAAGCRRLMSCCHSASSSLSWLLSDDACLLLSVSNLLMRLHVCMVIESLKWANRDLLTVPFGCCNSSIADFYREKNKYNRIYAQVGLPCLAGLVPVFSRSHSS